MTCTVIRGSVDVFICKRTSKERCSCGRPAMAHCDFELRGPKAGARCDKPLCQWCAVERGDKVLCQAHGRAKP